MEAAFFRVHGRERPNIACISTQLGCAVRCQFCSTAETPFFRNLTSREMLSEITAIVEDQDGPRLLSEGFEVSFMGMGEPLANLKNVLTTVREIGRRYPEVTRVSVSTAGPAERIHALTREMPIAPAIHLQISLHATNDETRRRLMPNAPERISKLLSAGRKYHEVTGDQVFLNYVLIKGVNDSPEDARWLAQLDHGAFYIKISQLNTMAGLPAHLVPASMKEILHFSSMLAEMGAAHKVFVGDGLDVQASCGQLAAIPRELMGMELGEEGCSMVNLS
jgi:23S rRNA (adenine2503-C2)-methyltransferase